MFREHSLLVPPNMGCQITSRVGAGAVWMSGGDVRVAQAHPGTFPVSTRFLVEPGRLALVMQSVALSF